MSARFGALLLAAVLVLYIVLVGQRAWLLLVSGAPLGIAIGVVLIVFPLLAAWALARELWFGFRAEQIAKRLESEDDLPDEAIAVRPSGRPLREDAAGLFPAYREAVEADPENWRGWFRLALAYDGAGDRKRARAAVRAAIRLEAAERRAAR